MPATPDNRRKILYIIGYCRSGSTVIDNILGQLDGFFSAGEIWDLWVRSCEAPCSCGKPIKDCEIWIAIFRQAFGKDPASADFEGALRLAQRTDRLHHIWWLTNALGRKIADRAGGVLSQYLDLTQRLYRSAFSVSGARVIIDSSKSPAHCYILGLLSVAELYVVHLVRDPRGSAYSWSLPSKTNIDANMRGAVRASLEWDFNHLVSEWLFARRRNRYLRISYEQFAEHPRAVMGQIVEFVGEAGAELPFISDQVVQLRPLHGYGGSIARYSGQIEIKRDEKWRSAMDLPHKLGVTALTALGLLRYGYPLNAFAAKRT